MASNDELSTVQNENAFLKFVRSITGRTNLFKYRDGSIKHRAYPPKTNDSEIEAIVFHMSNIPDKAPGISLPNLKEVYIPSEVKSVSEDALKDFNLNLLQIDNKNTSLTSKALSRLTTKILRYSGNEFMISPYLDLYNIHFDNSGNLSFKSSDSLSLGQADEIERRSIVHKKTLREFSELAQKDSIASLFEKAKIKDSSSIIITGKVGETYYSINATVGDYNELINSEDIDPSQVIGLYVNGVDSLNLSTLAKFPALKQVYLTQDVRNVVGNIDGESHSSLKINRAGYVERNVKSRNTSFDMYYSPKSTSLIKEVNPISSPNTPSQEKHIENDLEK